jgi:CheY-like chemotaxis protein
MAEVLVVDDDPFVRDVLGQILRRRGHTVFEAPDADTALQQLAAQPIAVALIDRYMPERDGLWLIGRMQEEFSTVAIILATGDDAIPPRLTLQPGIVGYLVKPIAPELLLSAVNDGVTWHEVSTRHQRKRE